MQGPCLTAQACRIRISGALSVYLVLIYSEAVLSNFRCKPDRDTELDIHSIAALDVTPRYKGKLRIAYIIAHRFPHQLGTRSIAS